MRKLKSDVHPKFSDDVIQRLHRKNISTIIEFILEDSEKLIAFTGLSYKEILEIKQNISEKYGGKIRNALDLLKTEQSNIVPTNISSLDKLLEGGLYPGQIYELCGPSASGKSQLCLTIAANVAKENNIVRYIDTKRDFCSSRVEEMLTAKNCSKQVIAETMERMKVCCIYSLHQLFKVLQYLKATLKEETQELRTRVIIIDSLPAIIFKYSKDHRSTCALNHLANICRFIANEFSLSLISTNLSTQWNNANEKSPGSSAHETSKNVMPMLGKYWLHVPNTRLMIEKIDCRSRKITVSKSFQLERNISCTLNISNTGMS